MARVFNTFPDIPAHTQAVTLAGTVYRVRLIWRERAGGWYIDLFERDGTPIRLGKRLSADWSPLHTAMDAEDEGLVYVFGRDEYDQSDLGDDLTLLYISPEEIIEAAQS